MPATTWYLVYEFFGRRGDLIGIVDTFAKSLELAKSHKGSIIDEYVRNYKDIIDSNHKYGKVMLAATYNCEGKLLDY